MGRNKKERLRGINERLKQFNKDYPSSACINNIREENILLASGWAELHGQTIKAASCRHLAPFVNQLCDDFFSGDDLFHKSVKKVANSMCHVYDVLYRTDTFMSEAESDELEQALQHLGKHMQLLRQLSEEKGWQIFQIKPKCHYAMHVGQQPRLISPRACQN